MSKSAYAWFIVVIASLAFTMEFASMNIFNIINANLIQHFHMTATQLGWFSATYYMSNVIFIPITGILLDKYSAKWLLVIAVGLSVIGLSFLGYAPFSVAVVLRFISGACNPLTILGAMRIAYNWLPPKRWGLASSLVVSLGMLGGLASQDPLSYFFQLIGWQPALLWFLSVGVVVAVLIMVMVQDSPHQLAATLRQQRQKIQVSSGLKAVFNNIQNWKAGLFTAGMNTPVNLLGGLWGVAYCMVVFQVSHLQATLMMSIIFVGAAVGGLVLGGVSDVLQRRKIVCILSALLTLVLLALLMSGWPLTISVIEVVFFGLGFLSSAQDLSFAVASDSNASEYTGMSIAMVALFVQSAALIFQPLSGYLIDLVVPQGVPTVAADFRYFIWIFPVMAVVALIASLCMRETYCKRK